LAQYRFGLDSPRVSLVAPAPEQRFDMSKINGLGYIDIQFTDTTGRGINTATILDAGQEFRC
jgi:hypothetical protein